jgi:hypothetical protein
MFWVGTFITGAAKSLKHLEEPAAPAAAAVPPPPQKSLAELIADRKVRVMLAAVASLRSRGLISVIHCCRRSPNYARRA